MTIFTINDHIHDFVQSPDLSQFFSLLHFRQQASTLYQSAATA